MRSCWCVVLVGLLAACAGSAGEPSQPITFERAIGDTDQGLRMRVERTGEAVALRVVADCDDGRSSNPEQELIRGEVSDDGTFEAELAVLQDWPDGDEGRLTATVEGRFDGEVAEGTVEARVRYWNGQADAFDERECHTGPIRWRLRSGSWEWSAAEEIPVAGVSWIAASDEGGALAFGPVHGTEPGPFAMTVIAGDGEVHPRVDLPIGAPDMVDFLDAWSLEGRWLWAVTRFDAFEGAIGRYDTTSGRSTEVPGMVDSLASDGDHLWTIGITPGPDPIHSLQRRDLETGEVEASTTASDGRVLVAGDRVWVVGEEGTRATAYDRVALTVVEEIDLPPLYVLEARAGDRVLWVNGQRLGGGAVILRVDLETGEVVEHPVEAVDLSVVGDEAWVVQPRQRTVRVLDREGVVRTYDLAVTPTSIDVGGDPTVVWVATADQEVVVRLVP